MKQAFEKLLAPLRSQGEQGYVLLLCLLMAMTLFITLSGILSLSLTNLASVKRSMFDSSALNAAEAGIDNAILQLNNTNGSYSGTSTAASCPSTGMNGDVTVFDDSVKGKGTFSTCVTPSVGTTHEYLLYSWGKVYRKSSDASPISTRKLKVVVTGSPAGSYAVQTGPGGLIMRNSAAITQGPVYIGGYLDMRNSATIGTSAIPIAVNVANARCNNGANTFGSPYTGYPTVCNTGIDPNPITLESVQNAIYGTVNGNDQTNFYSSQATNTGIANSGTSVTAPTLPGYDRVSQVNAVTTTIAASSICAGHTSTANIAANTKITGDLTLSNSCTVTINGNVWLTGSLDLRNSAKIVLADTAASQPTFMVDGSSGVVLEQTSSIVPNSSNIGIEFIAFYSATSCTTGTTAATYCDSLSGASLANSQNLITVNFGNSGNAQYSVFYSKYTETTVGQKGTLGALLGQTIDLAQSGNLVFTSTVVTGNYSYDASFYEISNW